MTQPRPNRRHALAGLAATFALPALAGRALADAALDLTPFGLVPDSGDDQSERLQAALSAAVAGGKPLLLPAGDFYVHDLDIPGFIHLQGVPGRTRLASRGELRIGRISAVSDLLVEGITFSCVPGASTVEEHGLIEIDSASEITFRNCAFVDARANGVAATNAQVTIEACVFERLGQAAIFNFDGDSLLVRGNRIRECANAGIRIWRGANGRDGSIITGNRIGRIDWAGGGNGQTGNGVSIYLADDVIVADNVIEDCAFSAVRVNSGNNTQIRGNTCLNSGEVAIFSEFAFSGSVIADNIIDGAATGISITNLDSGGHLATCTGNIVRNIMDHSATNPDTRPVGIFAEAETIVANNSIENVPGFGIVAGYGPFLRNVAVSNNLISKVRFGIGVSVVQEQAPGPVRVSGNLIAAGSEHAIVGMEWENIVSDDLARDAGRYPNVTVSDNTVG